jgi:mannose-1-phosphate guanylyltransferase
LKAFLLAGGYGTRLRQLTDKIPKCLLPIRGKPLLDIWLDLCARSGITEILINLHAHVGVIEEHLRKTRAPVQVRVIREDRLLGSAGTLRANREWVDCDSASWVLYSDVLTNTNLKLMAELHARQNPLATLGLYRVPDPARCGVAVTDDAGVIIDFEEKPQQPRSHWAFSGLMVASPQLFDRIPDSIPADIGFHLLPRLVGKMMAYPITDFLLDIGTPANYEKAQASWPGGTLSTETQTDACPARCLSKARTMSPA